MRGFHIPCARAAGPFVWADADARRELYAVPTAFRAYKSYLERSIL